ncbi:sugar transferase [bacterium]|nr:sugar transferase [bacterium]
MPVWLEWIIAISGLIVLLPVYGIIALCVVIETKGPVLYRAIRIGYGESRFEMLKFRTMDHHADKNGPPITTRNDPRITRVGRWLRKNKLDELPQLINIIRGEMKFVGPRPEDPGIIEKYSEKEKRIFQFKPGITSPASLRYRDEENQISQESWEQVYLKEILPKKIEMDLKYMKNATVWSDFKIMFQTVFKAEQKVTF